MPNGAFDFCGIRGETGKTGRFHAASDYADMIVFAEPNSGNDGKPIAGHLFDIRFLGSDWLTSGARGTEASLLVFVVPMGLLYFFNRAYPADPSQPHRQG
jgi:hypothetical protein